MTMQHAASFLRVEYRLIASLHFNRGKVYIRHVLTHQAYDRGGWMT